MTFPGGIPAVSSESDVATVCAAVHRVLAHRGPTTITTLVGELYATCAPARAVVREMRNMEA